MGLFSFFVDRRLCRCVHRGLVLAAGARLLIAVLGAGDVAGAPVRGGAGLGRQGRRRGAAAARRPADSAGAALRPPARRQNWKTRTRK